MTFLCRSAADAERRVLKTKDDEIRDIQLKANSLQAEINLLQKQQNEHEHVQQHLQAILSAYRKVRIQFEGAVQGATGMPESMEHEDVILGRAADHFLSRQVCAAAVSPSLHEITAHRYSQLVCSVGWRHESCRLRTCTRTPWRRGHWPHIAPQCGPASCFERFHIATAVS